MNDGNLKKTISLSTSVIVEDEHELNAQNIGCHIIFQRSSYKVFEHKLNVLKKYAETCEVDTFFMGRLEFEQEIQNKAQQGGSSENIERFVDVAGNKDKDFYKRHYIVFESDPDNYYILDIQGNQITVAHGINKIRCSINEQGEITLAKKIKTSIENGKKCEREEDGEIDPNKVIPNLKLIREIANACNRYHREKENKEEER